MLKYKKLTNNFIKNKNVEFCFLNAHISPYETPLASYDFVYICVSDTQAVKAQNVYIFEYIVMTP